MLERFFNASNKNVTDIFMESIHKNLERGNVIVGIKNESVIGMLNVYCNNQETKEAYICNVEVLKEYRGLGIAGKLLKQALRIVSEKDFSSVTLYVDMTNTIAIHLYTSEGFFLTENKKVVDDVILLEMRKCLNKFIP